MQITGRFLYCTTNTNAGGSNTHTLTIAQMPSHKHDIIFAGSATRVAAMMYGNPPMSDNIREFARSSAALDTVGGNAPHNNMPSYQGVYAWRRVS